MRSIQADEQVTTIRLVELLPNLERLWLEDGDGARYTSELRLATFENDVSPSDAPERRPPPLSKRRNTFVEPGD